MRKTLTTILLCLLFSLPAQASESVYKNIPDAKIVGDGVLSVLFFDIYKAKLYAPKGRLTNGYPYALSIEYYHDIDKEDIANKSIEEIRKLGFNDDKALENWLTQMKKIFPNVKNGTELTAIFDKDNKTIFYENGKHIGSIKDKDFSKYFSGIWLNEKTSEPELRKKLLGLGRMDI